MQIMVGPHSKGTLPRLRPGLWDLHPALAWPRTAHARRLRRAFPARPQVVAALAPPLQGDPQQAAQQARLQRQAVVQIPRSGRARMSRPHAMHKPGACASCTCVEAAPSSSRCAHEACARRRHAPLLQRTGSCSSWASCAATAQTCWTTPPRPRPRPRSARRRGRRRRRRSAWSCFCACGAHGSWGPRPWTRRCRCGVARAGPLAAWRPGAVGSVRRPQAPRTPPRVFSSH